MKTFLILLIFSQTVSAKEIYEYSCYVDKDLKIEISLVDKNTPALSLFYKDSKFASCLYNNTLKSQAGNPRALITDAIWQLQQKSCTVYFEAHKDKIKLASTATFKQAMDKKAPSYLDVIENQQPVTCAPKK